MRFSYESHCRSVPRINRSTSHGWTIGAGGFEEHVVGHGQKPTRRHGLAGQTSVRLADMGTHSSMAVTSP